MTALSTTRLLASQARLAAALTEFDSLNVTARIERITRDCFPAAPTFHARIGDPSLSTIDCTGVITGNADLVCERGEPNPNPERPPQVYPLQSSESWTERSL